MTETNISQNIRVAVSKLGVRVFRNNVGALPDRNGRLVRYGLFVGSGDLIGWKPVTVTPDMVGKTVAVFASVEVKKPGGRSTPAQDNWRESVARAGGIAGIVYNEAEAITLFES